jgi:comEA protein
MNFTKAQLRGLWFIIIVSGFSLSYHYIDVLFLDKSMINFDDFNAHFIRKRDSLLAVDTFYYSKLVEKPVLMIKEKKFPININLAGDVQLQDLPRIGPNMADRIVQYRLKHGPFKTIEEIKKVKGIGDKTFEQLKDLIIVQ